MSAGRLRVVLEGDRDPWAYVLPLVAAVAAYTVSVTVFPHLSVNHDEGVYLQQAAMLLEGRLFLRPPVPEPFRPWFFVRAGDAFYPKYAPVPAAIFAAGKLFGGYRLALAGVAAAVVALQRDVVARLSDRRTANLAAALLVASPLFVVEAAVFLPYLPTTMLNLAFAAAYLRADASGSRRWAALAGGAVGLAFFARPYTALLFAAPFVAHALWRMRSGDRSVVIRQIVTAAFGLAGVAVALAYNAAVTGDPLVFPYQAFAPLDGLGFGRRALLGYEVMYTPELALRANARVLATFATEWVVSGLLGTVLAVVGAGVWMAGLRRRGQEGARRSDGYRLVLLGVGVTVIVGNVAFWGNLNIFGGLSNPTDGLLHYLGPYYHLDLLVPATAFAAAGALWLAERWRAVVGRRSRRVAVAGLVVGATVFGGVAAAAVAAPLADSATVTDRLDRAYEPVDDPPENLDGSLVFLPTPYGDWLNHPFQRLRNDPGYEGDTVYAMREDQFAVVDAFPDRRYYRYVYRGPWAPTVRGVTPRLQPVRAVSGERATVRASVGVPEGAESVSIRLASEQGTTYYVANGTGDLRTRLVVADGTARLAGNVTLVGDRPVPVEGRDDLVVTVNVDFGPGAGYAYRLVVPVEATGERVRLLTPYPELCTTARWCGGEQGYVPSAAPAGASLDISVSAGS